MMPPKAWGVDVDTLLRVVGWLCIYRDKGLTWLQRHVCNTHVSLQPVLHSYVPIHTCTCEGDHMGKHVSDNTRVKFKTLMKTFTDT